MSVIGSFQVFTQVCVLWPSSLGGPLGDEGRGQVLYEMGWNSFRFGYAFSRYALFRIIIFVLTWCSARSWATGVLPVVGGAQACA